VITVLVAIAGAMGAVARFLLDDAISARRDSTLPIATIVINTTGSLLLGVLTGLTLYHGLGADTRTVLGTGFCGGYTTFSTFAYQTVRLGEQDATRGALGNVALSFVLPAAAAALGLALMAW
jgi:CrcB protein